MNEAQSEEPQGAELVPHGCIVEVTLDAMAARVGSLGLSPEKYDKFSRLLNERRMALAALVDAGAARGLVCRGTGKNEDGAFVCPFESDTSAITKAVGELTGGKSVSDDNLAVTESSTGYLNVFGLGKN